MVHYQDGKILKGYLGTFSPLEEEALFSREEREPSEYLKIRLRDLKAIYYVKSHGGNKAYREKKQFGLAASKGKKVMVKFKDRELVCGFVRENLPWTQGTHLSNPDPTRVGFFLYPADPESNNTKIFVVTSSVAEIQEF